MCACGCGRVHVCVCVSEGVGVVGSFSAKLSLKIIIALYKIFRIGFNDVGYIVCYRFGHQALFERHTQMAFSL